jgi:hypothetical protein
MSETLNTGYEFDKDRFEKASRRLYQSKLAMIRYAREPIAGDQSLAKFYQAAIEQTEKADQQTESLGGWLLFSLILNSDKPFNAYNTANKIYRDVATEILAARGTDDFPRTKAQWHEAINFAIRQDHFPFHVATLEIMSNIPGRSRAPRALMQYMRQMDLLPENPSILDVGSSANVTLKELDMANTFSESTGKDNPFALRPFECGYLDKNGAFIETEAQSAEAKAILRAPMSIGSSVGIDLYDEEKFISIKDYITGCSFRPAEIIEHPEKVAIFQELLQTSRYDVGFYEADFTSQTEVDEFIKHSPDKKYDMVFFMTMRYMIPPEKQYLLIENALKVLKPTGHIFTLDFARVDRADPSNLLFYKNIYAKNSKYQQFIQSAQNPDNIIKLPTWTSGRCDRLIIPPDSSLREEYEKALLAA